MLVDRYGAEVGEIAVRLGEPKIRYSGA